MRPGRLQHRGLRRPCQQMVTVVVAAAAAGTTPAHLPAAAAMGLVVPRMVARRRRRAALALAVGSRLAGARVAAPRGSRQPGAAAGSGRVRRAKLAPLQQFLLLLLPMQLWAASRSGRAAGSERRRQPLLQLMWLSWTLPPSPATLPSSHRAGSRAGRTGACQQMTTLPMLWSSVKR